MYMYMYVSNVCTLVCHACDMYCEAPHDPFAFVEFMQVVLQPLCKLYLFIHYYSVVCCFTAFKRVIFFVNHIQSCVK